MSEVRSQEKRRPLAYHFQGEGNYGTGVCGTHGMIGTLDNLGYPVTCKRCKRHALYLAALRILARYAGDRR